MQDSERAQTRLGEMLRLWRTVRQMTLREVAPSIGISHSTLLRLEQGKPCDLPSWLKVQAWLLSDGGSDV